MLPYKHLKAEKSSTLLASPQLKRLQETLHDLLIIAYEQSTKTPSHSLNLIKWEYVSGVKSDSRYSMRLSLLVKEAAHLNDAVPLTLTLNVEPGEIECLENS